jgi:plasmid stability protein
MADILVRDVNAKILTRLKSRAKRNGRSLQSEAKSILESAAGFTAAEAMAAAKRWRQGLGRRRFSDSAALVREDRRR